MSEGKTVDAEALVNALADITVKELKAIRDRLADTEAELGRLRRIVDAEHD